MLRGETLKSETAFDRQLLILLDKCGLRISGRGSKHHAKNPTEPPSDFNLVLTSRIWRAGGFWGHGDGGDVCMGGEGRVEDRIAVLAPTETAVGERMTTPLGGGAAIVALMNTLLDTVGRANVERMLKDLVAESIIPVEISLKPEAGDAPDMRAVKLEEGSDDEYATGFGGGVEEAKVGCKRHLSLLGEAREEVTFEQEVADTKESIAGRLGKKTSDLKDSRVRRLVETFRVARATAGVMMEAVLTHSACVKIDTVSVEDCPELLKRLENMVEQVQCPL